MLMRAMGHNQTSHLAALKQAMPGTLEGIVRVMDSLKKIWDQSVKAMAVVESEGRATASAAFTRLVYYSGAPVIELLTASTQKAIKPIYMLATMLSTDYVVIPKITSGTAAQYLDVLGEQIRAMAPAHQKPSKTQVRRFLRRTLKQHGYGTQRFSMPNLLPYINHKFEQPLKPHQAGMM
ncbi:hypothetical protein BFW38_05830 [Terasakiispira papahanaumokuakeensis]|uniref:Uncharacterized protein n=2 Tax=Terasakiispira papahanaumokuakeensis TaxID=197479 RepID=A0A1E2V839_9GAMM|nr:hypothetical protein BFW38_05830 [Terasakiispira papahanaumokuakeensis]